MAKGLLTAAFFRSSCNNCSSSSRVSSQSTPLPFCCSHNWILVLWVTSLELLSVDTGAARWTKNHAINGENELASGVFYPSNPKPDGAQQKAIIASLPKACSTTRVERSNFLVRHGRNAEDL